MEKLKVSVQTGNWFDNLFGGEKGADAAFAYDEDVLLAALSEDALAVFLPKAQALCRGLGCPLVYAEKQGHHQQEQRAATHAPGGDDPRAQTAQKGEKIVRHSRYFTPA